MSGALDILHKSGLKEREPRLFEALVASLSVPVTLLYQSAEPVKIVGLFASRQHAYQMLALANGKKTQVSELQIQSDGL